MSIKLLENVTEFKNLVLKGLPKLFNEEQFEEEEQAALSLYLSKHGLPIDPYTGKLLAEGGFEEKADYIKLISEGLVLEVHSTFKAYYGI